MCRILIYDDSPIFGGHELISVEYIAALAESGHDVFIMYNQTCSRFREELDRINTSTAIRILSTDNISVTPQGFRTILSPWRIKLLSSQFLKLHLDIVLVLQGNIEWCTLGLMAARLAAIKTVSYIPMAQGMAKINARLGFVRDIVNRIYYHQPDRFITISENQRKLIAQNGCDPQKIEVVYNFLPVGIRPVYSREHARKRLGLSHDSILIGLIGRVDFHQKRQDFFVRAVSKYRHMLKGFHFFISGDGPDLSRLEELIRINKIGNVVSLSPWKSDTGSLYAALDALVLPSAYEGVPLVMLEAVEFGLPVIATNVDGMAEFLPQDWLFDSDDEQRMIALLRDCKSDHYRQLAEKTKNEFAVRFVKHESRQKFIQSVCAVVSG